MATRASPTGTTRRERTSRRKEEDSSDGPDEEVIEEPAPHPDFDQSAIDRLIRDRINALLPPPANHTPAPVDILLALGHPPTPAPSQKFWHRQVLQGPAPSRTP